MRGATPRNYNVKLRDIGDALIAATVAVLDVRLWTRNRRHYPMKDLAFYP